MDEATKEEWQDFFDKEFPQGARVFAVEDVIENLPYTDAVYTGGFTVLDVTDGDPTIKFWPLGGNGMQDYVYTLIETKTRPGGALQYRTNAKRVRYLVCDREIPKSIREDVLADRVSLMEVWR